MLLDVSDLETGEPPAIAGSRVLGMPSVPATGIDTAAVGVVGEDCKEDETSHGCGGS